MYVKTILSQKLFQIILFYLKNNKNRDCSSPFEIFDGFWKSLS